MGQSATEGEGEPDALQERLARAGQAEAGASTLPSGEAEALWAGVRAATVAARPTWRDRLRELPTGARVTIALGIALTLAAMMVLVVGVREVGPGAATERVVLALSGLTLLAAASFAVSLRGIHRRPLKGWAWAVIGLGLAVPFVLAVMPAGEVGLERGVGFGCLTIGIAAGALVSVPVFLMQRASVPVMARACAAMAGGGLVAFSLLELHCPSRDVTHLVVGHALVGVVLVVAAGVVAPLRR